MGKVRKPISNIKKANIAKNKSHKQRKLVKRHKERYNKKKPEDKPPVTYYDHKKIRDKAKEEKLAAANQKEKDKKLPSKSTALPMDRAAIGEDDMLTVDEIDAMIEQQDKKLEEDLQEEDSSDDEGKKRKLVARAKKLLNESNDDEDDEEEEEDEEVFTSKAEQLHHQKAAAAAQSLKAKKENALRPVHNLLAIRVDGQVIHPTAPPPESPEAEDSGFDQEEQEDDKQVSTVPMGNVPVVEVLAQRRRKLNERKIFIGCTATKIMRNPEGNMGGLLELVKMVHNNEADTFITVRKMAALSLLRLFKNILPSYRLASLDHKPGTKLKKATRAIAVKEGQMLSRYRLFLRALEGMMKTAEFMKYEGPHVRLASLSLHCFCELLHDHPVFNFSDNIIALIVPYLSHKEDILRDIAVKSFQKHFYEDNTGQMSLRLLKVIDQFVRKRKFQVHADVLRVLLQLRVTRATALDTSAARKLESIRAAAAVQQNLKKLASKNTIHLSITEKKRKRKVAVLEHKLQEKRREENKHKEDTLQTGMLHILFGLYVHVIKNNPNRKLLCMVLEGFANFGHLVNVDYFCDLLSTLDRVLTYENLDLTESVHCIQTVFRLLTGLGSALPNDPSNFSDKLFALLLSVDAANKPHVVLPMLRTLLLVFVGCKKRVCEQTSIGFVKRLSTLALALPHSQAVPVLMTVRSIMLNHPGTECLLDTTREGGSGVYRPELNHPVHCNATMTTLWEMHALTRSYHPMVCQIATHLYRGAPLLGDGCLPASFTKLNIDDVHKLYDSSEAQFQPHLLEPVNNCGEQAFKWTKERRKQAAQHTLGPELEALCAETEAALDRYTKSTAAPSNGNDDEDDDEEEDDDELMPDTFSDDDDSSGDRLLDEYDEESDRNLLLELDFYSGRTVQVADSCVDPDQEAEEDYTSCFLADGEKVEVEEQMDFDEDE